MFKVLNKKRIIISTIILVVCLIAVIIWAIRCYKINRMAFRQDIVHYSIGDTVELDGNFFFDASELTKGYSIRVNSYQIADYSELFKEYGRELPYSSDYPVNQNTILLNVTVKNKGNSDGCLPYNGFSLYHKSLQIPIDFVILNMLDPKIDGSITLRLRENTEVDLILPFTAMLLDEAINSKKLNEIIESEPLDLCVSEFPTRKLIQIKDSVNSR